MDYLDSTLIEFVHEHRYDSPQALALQARKYPHLDIPLAARCVEGWQKLLRKLPSWAESSSQVIIPDPVMVEQASSYETACYKSRFVPRGTTHVLDMSGGLGVDTSIFARSLLEYGGKVFYLDRAPERARLAKHNFRALGLHNVETHCGSAEEEGLSLIRQYPCDLVFIDPDRRAGQQRSFLLEQSSPNILTLLPQIYTIRPEIKVLIKLSPMLDLAYLQEALPSFSELHVVSWQRECKELLLYCGASIPPRIFATDLMPLYSSILEASPHPHTVNIGTSGTYLYDLSPTLAKIGWEHFAHLFPTLTQADTHTHLYFGNEAISNFPGRAFKIIEELTLNKETKRRLRGARYHVVAKNTPFSSQEFMREMGITEGGDDFIFIFTTDNHKKRIILRAQRL